MVSQPVPGPGASRCSNTVYPGPIPRRSLWGYETMWMRATQWQFDKAHALILDCRA